MQRAYKRVGPPPPDHVPDSEIEDDWYLNQRQTRRFRQERHEDMLRQMDHNSGYPTPELEWERFRTPARSRTLSMGEIEVRRVIVLAAFARRHQVVANEEAGGRLELAL